jgi:hypothetical protein
MASGGTSPGAFGVQAARPTRASARPFHIPAIGSTIGKAASKAIGTPSSAQPAAASSAPAAVAPSAPASPWDAVWAANNAALQHQYEHAQALYGTGENGEPLGSSRAEARAGENFRLQTIAREMPNTERGTRSKANAEGLLESGQLAQRMGTVEAKYASTRAGEALKLGTAEKTSTEDLLAARERMEAGQITDAEKALERGEKAAYANPPQEAAPATAVAPPGPPTHVISSRPQPKSARARAVSKARRK